MKVIIDISKDVYAECQGHIYFPDTGGELFNAVKNGTPLDDVKAEIQAKEVVETDIERQFYNMALDDVNKILDNIGKAESEDKE